MEGMREGRQVDKLLVGRQVGVGTRLGQCPPQWRHLRLQQQLDTSQELELVATITMEVATTTMEVKCISTIVSTKMMIRCTNWCL